jgi:hypothetical protein
MGSGIFAWICGGGNRVGNRTCQVSILSGLTNKSLDDGVRSSGVVMSTTWGCSCDREITTRTILEVIMLR